MSQTRVSKFFKQKETAKNKRKQTSIDTFCVKKERHKFDDKVTCLILEKKKKHHFQLEDLENMATALVWTSYKISIIYSSLINGIMKSKVNSTLSRQNQKPHEKDLVLKNKKK